MLVCPQCGFENRDSDKFCANCGEQLARSPQPVAEPTPDDGGFAMPPPVTPTFEGGTRRDDPHSTTSRSDFDFSKPLESVDEDWKMFSLDPPPPPKRRWWLWIIVGLFALCVLSCVGFGGWIAWTDSGQEFWDNVEASVTQQALSNADATSTAEAEFATPES